MKIILSRKGCDSEFGSLASPILPSGELWSIPIPDTTGASATRYEQLCRGKSSLGDIVNCLSKKRIQREDLAHFDPDLDKSSIERKNNDKWRGIFGQGGAAEQHLKKQKVGKGDLFLFFGSFKKVEQSGESWRYENKAPDLHVLFGWLQIDEKWNPQHVLQAEGMSWAWEHPNCLMYKKDPTLAEHNMYFGRAALSLEGKTKEMPGAGIFRTYRPELCLTAPGCTRTVWALPRWFYPEGKKSSLTYNPPLSPKGEPNYTLHEDHVRLKSAGKGQEFVLDATHYPEAVGWVRKIIEDNG